MLPYPGQGDLRVQTHDIFYVTADEWVGDRGRPLDLDNDVDARWGIRGGHGVRLHFRQWPELSLELRPRLSGEPVTAADAAEARHHLTRAVRFLEEAGHWSGYDSAFTMADFIGGFFATYLARRHWKSFNRSSFMGFNPNRSDGTASLIAALVYGAERSGLLYEGLRIKALEEVKPWTISAITLQTIANLGVRAWLRSLGERTPGAWEALLLAALPDKEARYEIDRDYAQAMLILLAEPELEPWPQLTEVQAKIIAGPGKAAWDILKK